MGYLIFLLYCNMYEIHIQVQKWWTFKSESASQSALMWDSVTSPWCRSCSYSKVGGMEFDKNLFWNNSADFAYLYPCWFSRELINDLVLSCFHVLIHLLENTPRKPPTLACVGEEMWKPNMETIVKKWEGMASVEPKWGERRLKKRMEAQGWQRSEKREILWLKKDGKN